MSNMKMAFTIKADRRVSELSTEVAISPAQSIYGANSKHIPAKAIWDTGATHTCISSRVVNELKLQPVSKTQIASVSTTETVNVYFIDIVLPNSVRIVTVKVSEPSGLNSCDVLIGMDIITLGDFAITNAQGRTCFSFMMPPDKNHTDYVPQSDIHNKLEAKRRKSAQQ